MTRLLLIALALALIVTPGSADAAPILLAVAGSLITSAIGGFAAGWGISLAISVLSAGLKMAMAGKQKSPEFTPFVQTASDRTHMVRSSIQAHRWIYGTAKVSGPMVAAFSSVNKFQMHMVIPLAGHQVARFQETWANDTLTTDTRFATPVHGDVLPYVRLTQHAGTCGQVADSGLVAAVTDWTSAHRLRGLAYMVPLLYFRQSIFPTGIPNFACVLDGRLVYDPRDTGVTVLTSSSANPAVFTTSGAHGLAVGDRVWLRDHIGAVPMLPASYDGPSPAIAKEFEVASVPTSATLTLADPYRRSEAYGNDNYVALATGGTGGTVTKMKWTSNAALCIADYHWAPVGGDCDIDEVDQAVLIASANVCDEYVTVTSDPRVFTADAATDEITLAAGEWETGDRLQVSTTGGLPAGLSAATNYYWIRTGPSKGKLATSLANARAFTGINLTTAGTGTNTATKAAQLRYTMNGTFDLDAVPPGVVEDMLTAMAGARPYAQGSYRIIAGAYETPTRTITIDHLAGDIDVEPFLKRAQLYNAVRGTFVDPSQLWVPTEFPLLTDGVYEGQDGGERIYRDIELPFTTDSTRAQRLAMIALLKSRQAVTAILPCNWSALDIGLWDTINVTIAQLGWSAKVFRVTDIGYPDEGGVTLTVQEEASSSYSWAAGDATDYDPAPNTSLPDPWTSEPPTGLTLESGDEHLFQTGDGTVHSRIYSAWTAQADGFVSNVDVRFKPTAASTWKMITVPGDDTDAYLDPVEDGVEYQVQIRSVNTLGVQSDWAPEPAATHTVVGHLSLPPDVLTFSVTRMADGTRRFTWTHDIPLPADVRSGGGFLICYALGIGLAWGDLAPMHTGRIIASPFETNELAAGTYTFGIKMVDTSGNESANAAIIEATLGDPRLREVLLSQSERTLGWPGTIVDAFINPENYLEATGAQTWNDLPATWALLAATWAGIVINDSPITYTTQQIDLGVNVSFTPLVSVEGLGSMTITMQLGTTADGAVTGAFVPIGSVTAKRYMKIKVEVAGTTPLLRELVTLVDAALQIEDYEDIDTSAASAGRVERIATGHFKIATRGDTAAISQAQITAFQNAGSGWTWELLSKSTTITGDPEPAAEFKIYKSLVLTDALIDAEIKGLKLS